MADQTDEQAELSTIALMAASIIAADMQACALSWCNNRERDSMSEEEAVNRARALYNESARQWSKQRGRRQPTHG